MSIKGDAAFDLKITTRSRIVQNIGIRIKFAFELVSSFLFNIFVINIIATPLNVAKIHNENSGTFEKNDIFCSFIAKYMPQTPPIIRKKPDIIFIIFMYVFLGENEISKLFSSEFLNFSKKTTKKTDEITKTVIKIVLKILFGIFSNVSGS